MRVPGLPPPLGALRFSGSRRWSTELFAGITLAALCLPLNIGYADAAGLPAVVGIYASLAPLVVFALLTGSRRLATGPDATIAALLAASLPGLSASTGVDPTDLAVVCALLVGAVLAVCWLLRLGALVRFLSKAVLVGFIGGLGVEILTSQIEKIMNVSVDADGWVREVIALFEAIPDASVASVTVGVGTIAIVRLTNRFAPKLPAALIALVLVTLVVELTQPGGVDVLGDIPSGLPKPALPVAPLGAWLDLVPTAVTIAALTMAEGLLLAKKNAITRNEDFDPNSELAALGATNVASALTGGMPIGASASRTAALASTGNNTQIPAVVAALVIALVVLFFDDAVAQLPSAALAGLVANAVLATIDVPALRRFAAVRRSELAIAVGCGLGVLILGPLPGIVLATLVSTVDVVRRAASAPWATLEAPAFDREIERFRAAPSPEHPPGLVVLRVGGPLFYANADLLRDTIALAAYDPETRWVVLDLETASDIDPTAAEAFGDAVEHAHREQRVVAVSRASAPMRTLLDRYGLSALIGEEHLFESNRAAEVAYRAGEG